MIPSRIEQALLKAQPINPAKEWEVEILRQILCGELGTKNQRASLLRMIEEHRPDKTIVTSVLRNVGIAYPAGHFSAKTNSHFFIANRLTYEPSS